jgi:hypothetical protein
MPRPCHSPACLAAKGLECVFPIWFAECGRVWFIKMWSVNQKRPHCVNQMGKTHSKPLAARHGRGTAWARHGNGMLCVNPPLMWCRVDWPMNVDVSVEPGFFYENVGARLFRIVPMYSSNCITLYWITPCNHFTIDHMFCAPYKNVKLRMQNAVNIP